MKKTILQFLIAFLTFGSTLVYAETNTTDEATITKTPIKNEIRDLKQKIASTTAEMKSEIKDARAVNASTTMALREALKAQILHRFTPMTERIEATIVREESIMSKITSRIAKIHAAGGNTEMADKFVADAGADLKAARAKIELIKNIILTQATQGTDVTTGTTTTARAALVNLRKASQELEKEIRDAHKALNKAVESLRSNEGRNATTTDKEKTTQVNGNNQ